MRVDQVMQDKAVRLPASLQAAGGCNASVADAEHQQVVIGVIRVGHAHAPGVVGRGTTRSKDIAAAVGHRRRPEDRRQPVDRPALADPTEVDARAFRQYDAARPWPSTTSRQENFGRPALMRAVEAGAIRLERAVVARGHKLSQDGGVEEAAGALRQLQSQRDQVVKTGCGVERMPGVGVEPAQLTEDAKAAVAALERRQPARCPLQAAHCIAGAGRPARCRCSSPAARVASGRARRSSQTTRSF